MLEQGYDVTTVEAICAAADISRSTFFRYFTSKEDAVLTDIDETGDHLLEALQARPNDEPVWTALRRALEPLLEHHDVEPQPGRQLAALITTTPGLTAYQHEKHARWGELLRPEIARRIGADLTDEADPRPTAIIAAALACLNAAVGAWAAVDHPTPIGPILDRAMDAVHL